jgi:hypothetical protein
VRIGPGAVAAAAPMTMIDSSRGAVYSSAVENLSWRFKQIAPRKKLLNSPIDLAQFSAGSLLFIRAHRACELATQTSGGASPVSGAQAASVAVRRRRV